MNKPLKYLGVFVLLIGVVILVLPTITHNLSNSTLLVGIAVIVAGYLGHIFLNKKIE
ncbi:MAG: hypothetical protein LBU37_06285 [Tannerellaceae bacterium]|jgi:uncharacterized membrane protein HdeD (DUF308 family)|nr:hypothetical protein [Tannerellaceae bacterium]